MYQQIGATLAFARQASSNATFVRTALSRDAIAERDRRDFEESLRAQAERLNRQPDARAHGDPGGFAANHGV